MEASARSLMQALDSAVILVSETGKVLFSNAAADHLMGKKLPDVRLAPESFTDTSPLSLTIAESFERLSCTQEESEIIADGTGDNARFYSLSLSRPVDGPEGRLLIIHDVSDVLTRSNALARVVSQISHDLRSPLTSVSGAAELLLSGRTGELSEAHRRMVGIIDEGARKIEAILSGAKARFSVQTAEAGKEES